MFMGKAQLVELGLKNLLKSNYGCDEEKIERWTLGRAVKELSERGLRQDFIQLMDELKEHRNYIAHEMLANDAILRRLAGVGAHRIAWKSLRRGLYLVEEAIVVHDFLFGVVFRDDDRRHSAQQRKFHNVRGHVVGRSATNSQGTATNYEANPKEIKPMSIFRSGAAAMAALSAPYGE